MATHGCVWFTNSDIGTIKIHGYHDGYPQEALQSIFALPFFQLAEHEAKLAHQLATGDELFGSWRVGMLNRSLFGERGRQEKIDDPLRSLVERVCNALEQCNSMLTLSNDCMTLANRFCAQSPGQWIPHPTENKCAWLDDYGPDITVEVDDDRLPLVCARVADFCGDPDETFEAVQSAADAFNKPFLPFVPYTVERDGDGAVARFSPDLIHILACAVQALSLPDPLFSREKIRLFPEEKDIPAALLGLDPGKADPATGRKAQWTFKLDRSEHVRHSGLGKFSPVPADPDFYFDFAISLAMTLCSNPEGSYYPAALQTLVDNATPKLISRLELSNKGGVYDEPLAAMGKALLEKTTPEASKRNKPKAV